MSEKDDTSNAKTHADAVLTIWILSQELGITVEDAASIYIKVSSALISAMNAKGKVN